MASYHLSVKTISRSQGRSATAAAAYRAGETIACERYGVEHDYTRKEGIEYTGILTPSDAPDWSHDRALLWNAVETKETRKNSMVAREWEVALPHELDADQRRDLVISFSRDLVERYGIVADVAIHAPHRDGDQRNHHAHILTTTRTITPEGLDAKTRALHGQSGSEEIKAMREHWAELSNTALERAGQSERVDHRSLDAQRQEAERDAEDAVKRGNREDAERHRQRVEWLDRPPEPKLGVAATGLERRAQRRAEREGREYTPVTERGAAVARSRADRSMLAEARERLVCARDAYSKARAIGQGRTEATSKALKALLVRSKGKGPWQRRKSPQRVLDRGAVLTQQEARATGADMDRKLRRLMEELDPNKAGRSAQEISAPSQPRAERQDRQKVEPDRQAKEPPRATPQRQQPSRDRDDGLDR